MTVHFHPDRLVGDQLLIRRLATDGLYGPQSQRQLWEHQVFGGAYDKASDAQRPKYGSLNHRCLPEGGSVRSGSSHLRLASQVLPRTTFCYPAGSTEPADFGTAEHLPLVARDDYIEAQVHGPLRLRRDVEALVLDPCYRGTEIEAAAAALPFPTEWHHGFRLSVEELAAYDADVLSVGTQVAEDGWLDARVIGDAVRTGRYDERSLDQLWHHVARYGGVSR